MARPGRVPAVAALALTVVFVGERPPESAGQDFRPSAGFCAAAQLAPAGVPAAIRARLEEPQAGRGVAADSRRELRAVYEATACEPRWSDQAGALPPAAQTALRLLEDAATHGFRPDDYGAVGLRIQARRLEAGHGSTPDLAGFDVAMTTAVLRYFRHLHLGRISPTAVGFSMPGPPEAHDFAVVLASALRDGRLAEVAGAMAPPLAQYRLLRDALARYRALEIGAPPPLAAPIRPGDERDEVPRLIRQLTALGDLPGDVAIAPRTAYTDDIVDGVRRFQRRHGLDPDGVIGKATHAALAVPIDRRIRQIELALERLRWLPDLPPEELIALNIPMFTLWAWDVSPPTGPPAVEMRAIVGRAVSTQTPILFAEMREVIFHPYWNVPTSILRNELLPTLGRDPDALRRGHYEIVSGGGDDAAPVPLTAASLAGLRAGTLRLRQRPGPWNALGLAKFVFPNAQSIYMHGTPAQALFDRPRRDFSHGCVRVEDAAALAAWVLRDRPEWTAERISAAMAGPRPESVALTRPIQVALFYLTAAVDHRTGEVRFSEDVYGHDAKLERALGGGS